MSDITSANAVLMLTILGLYPGVQIQGFATDDAFDMETVEIAQVVMGVDGRMSGGAVPIIKPQKITLQADSPSAIVFDTWAQSQNITGGGNGVLLRAGEILSLPAIGMKFILTNGILRNYKPHPSGKKVLGPRDFTIVWEQITAVPIA